ncbi:MAG: hypothetical protein KatS3mg036_0508 [Ignavibacterium sp.]|uniref:hypothetical protein n=1 Tax=Ignavibacterium sp. TaxID=2651167 RepID=UPI0021DE9AE5|nr:hypothetical protein [Ignavibacterium sp.]BDQ01954.1 MAG: hypothetical protein KatS3mg037_0529 [Ignavibacterium sp.]GIV45690.1 MAG: hypothetical protein KatS3mg036_0508 [Ignavibacterium sp.]
MLKFIKYLLSSRGYISSTRFVKILISITFVFDWLYTRVIDRQPKFEPTPDIILIVASILGVSLVQKYLEGK